MLVFIEGQSLIKDRPLELTPKSSTCFQVLTNKSVSLILYPIAMPKILCYFVLLAWLSPLLSYGLHSSPIDTVSHKYLSLGSKKAGICFGNSSVYTGLRFNVLNKHVRQTNILDINVFSLDDSYDTEHINNGLALGVIFNNLKQNNGISLSGLLNSVSEGNGIAIAGLFNVANKQNGLALGLMLCFVDTVNGMVMSACGVSVGPASSKTSIVNGVALAAWYVNLYQMNGLSIGVINRSEMHKGVAIGGYNRSKKLRGLQIGLFNVAENNPRLFRRLPFINMHLGK